MYGDGDGKDDRSTRGSATGEWTDRGSGDDADASSRPSLTQSDGSFDRDAVRDVAGPIFDRWERDRHLDAARGRVQRVFGAAVVVLAVTWLFEPDGLAGFVLQLWSFASLPIAAVTGALLATLRNPTRSKEIWWDDGALLTLGFVLVAWLSRVAVSSPVGRVAWQLLFAESSPTGRQYGYDVPDDIDEARVAELRGYVTYLVAGSIAVVALDWGTRLLGDGGLQAVVDLLTGAGGGIGGGSGGGLPGLPSTPAIPTDPVSVVALLAAALVVGSVLGIAIAIGRER